MIITIQDTKTGEDIHHEVIHTLVADGSVLTRGSYGDPVRKVYVTRRNNARYPRRYDFILWVWDTDYGWYCLDNTQENRDALGVLSDSHPFTGNDEQAALIVGEKMVRFLRDYCKPMDLKNGVKLIAVDLAPVTGVMENEGVPRQVLCLYYNREHGMVWSVGPYVIKGYTRTIDSYVMQFSAIDTARF